tara:strand:- start:26 stop:679 length:654 start_codon:yes stop_codon:yes gene_type:complete
MAPRNYNQFFKRLLSALIFVPLIIYPIFLKGYLLFFVYNLILTLMCIEIANMIKLSSKKKYLFFYEFLCFVSIILFIISIVSIDNLSKITIEIIFLIWIFDTFSYLGGKLFGGKKLIPKISEGKTYSGLFSGVFVSIIVSQLYIYFNYQINIELLFYTTLIIIISFIGDLIASLIKRSVNIKDTGFIIPGHGGIIDRMDSFILVFFFFGLYLLIFGY